tara:strand:+ start:98597 stop:98737 length:141 start_codon:yes stop_codon:yes gene_type:complete
MSIHLKYAFKGIWSVFESIFDITGIKMFNVEEKKLNKRFGYCLIKV